MYPGTLLRRGALCFPPIHGLLWLPAPAVALPESQPLGGSVLFCFSSLPAGPPGPCGIEAVTTVFLVGCHVQARATHLKTVHQVERRGAGPGKQLYLEASLPGRWWTHVPKPHLHSGWTSSFFYAGGRGQRGSRLAVADGCRLWPARVGGGRSNSVSLGS